MTGQISEEIRSENSRDVSFDLKEVSLLDLNDPQQHIEISSLRRYPYCYNFYKRNNIGIIKEGSNLNCNFLELEGTYITLLGLFKYDKDSDKI